MKVNYKGFEVYAKREKALGGGDNLYFYIMRKSDGYFLSDGFTTGDDTVKDYIGYLKESVDDFLKNPQDWEEDEELWNG